MLCPRDKTSLTEQRYEAHVQVDACGTCGGMWLDDGELEAIQESRERDHRRDLDAMPDLVGAVGAHAEPGACPKCGAVMESREYAHCSRIVVDVCPEGHGIWLDGGELRALEIFFEKAKLSANTEDEGLWAMRSFWVSLKGLFRKK
jgi:uncharacterized protein